MSKLNENKIKDIISVLSLDMIDNAGSGHPGIALSISPILYTLFTHILNVDNEKTDFPNRDRFVLSSGHGSSALYSALSICYNTYDINDLKTYRRINSVCKGHPELDIEHRIETTTGMLGQGIANAVGMAIAEKYLSAKFNSKKNILFDYKVYCLCGEGDLMEGISYEATSLAGSLNLDNLVIIYDANNITMDGDITNTFNESVIERFEAMEFEVLEVKDGNNIKELKNVLEKASKSKKPVLVGVNTVLGRYSKYENTSKVHSGPLDKDDLTNIKEKLKLPLESFTYDKDEVEVLRNYIKERNAARYSKWYLEYEKYKDTHTDEEVEVLDNVIRGEDIILQLDKVVDTSKLFVDKTMRDINYQIMNVINAFVPLFMGGSADMVSSTKTYLKHQGDFTKDNYIGKNIAFGVREHAMGGILNGIALSNLRVFGSTHLAFSNYMIPAIRCSAMMNLPVTYIFTHDNFTIGSDGVTHQPIEQLTMLRSIPNLTVYRPADYKELIGSWNLILTSGKPSVLVLPKEHTDTLEHTSIKGVKYGGYIVSEVKSKLDLILLSSGEELSLAMKLKDELLKSFIEARVVSVPNLNIFIKQEKGYIEQVLPKGYKKMVLEFSNDPNYFRFVNKDEDFIGVNKYLKSGTKEELMKEYEFDIPSLVIKIKNSL